MKVFFAESNNALMGQKMYNPKDSTCSSTDSPLNYNIYVCLKLAFLEISECQLWIKLSTGT